MTATYKRFAKTISRKCYGWSKWGGAREGLVKETLQEWYCQACGEKQTIDLPAFMYEIVDNEFVRLCSRCYAVSKAVRTFEEIKQMTHTVLDNLSLATLKPIYGRNTGASLVSLSGLDRR